MWIVSKLLLEELFGQGVKKIQLFWKPSLGLFSGPEASCSLDVLAAPIVQPVQMLLIVPVEVDELAGVWVGMVTVWLLGEVDVGPAESVLSLEPVEPVSAARDVLDEELLVVSHPDFGCRTGGVDHEPVRALSVLLDQGRAGVAV